MTMYFKDGFFDDSYGGFVPEGAVEISQDKYIELINGQSQGKQIIADKTGNPVLIDPQPSAAHELNNDTLQWEISAEKQTALLADAQTRLIANIDEHAAKYTAPGHVLKASTVSVKRRQKPLRLQIMRANVVDISQTLHNVRDWIIRPPQT